MSGSEPSDDLRTFRYSLDDPFEPVLTICRAVARVTGVDATDLEPLGRVVDPDGLIEQFGAGERRTEVAGSNGDRTAGPTVAFEYEGCLVRVESGRIAIDERNDTSS